MRVSVGPLSDRLVLLRWLILRAGRGEVKSAAANSRGEARLPHGFPIWLSLPAQAFAFVADLAPERRRAIRGRAVLQKFNDSYNWSLMKLIRQHEGVSIYDCCFLERAHRIAIDGLNFFLCDGLLKVGGYMDFDYYDWRLRGTSLDPSKNPGDQRSIYDEQIDASRVRMKVDDLA